MAPKPSDFIRARIPVGKRFERLRAHLAGLPDGEQSKWVQETLLAAVGQKSAVEEKLDHIIALLENGVVKETETKPRRRLTPTMAKTMLE